MLVSECCGAYKWLDTEICSDCLEMASWKEEGGESTED